VPAPRMTICFMEDLPRVTVPIFRAAHAPALWEVN